MEHGVRRDEAINNAANIHAASYNAYCALYNALDVVGSQYQAQHRATGQATGREGKKMKKENIMESYIRYKVDDMAGCDLDQVLNSASKMYAFDDCTYIKVLEVVHDGKHYEYDGWEPGMTFTFRDEAGEIAWSRSFPHWDH